MVAKTLCSILFIGIAGAAVAQLPSSIADLSIGMTSLQVKQKLGSAYAEKLQQEPAFPHEPVSSVMKPSPGSKVQDGYSFVYVDDRVVYIQHANGWSNVADGPNLEQTMMSLRAKFGAPTYGGGSNFRWLYSDTGVPRHDGACDIRTTAVFTGPGASLSLPVTAIKGCGVCLDVTLGVFNSNNAVLSGLGMTLLDGAKYYAAVLQTQNRLNNKQKEMIDKSKSNKAPI